MEDVAVIYKSSPREATPSLQSERITSALSFLSIRTPRPALSRHRRERRDLRHRSAPRAKLQQAILDSNTNNAQWIRHRPQDVYCDLRIYGACQYNQ